MTQNKTSLLLKVSLVLFAIVAIGYGLVHLLIPEAYVKSMGGEPIPPSWLRWIGGIMIPLGIGALMVLRKPNRQGIFISTIASGTLMCGVILLFSLLFENEGIGYTLATAAPAIINLILSGLFWICLNQSKELLWGEEK